MSKKVIVAMSGGVDSSLTAHLLKNQGYDCIGATMKLYHNEDIGIPKGHTCCSLDDTEDARTAAHLIGIPHYVFNFTADFQKSVMDNFVAAYENGMTPNPCIECNRCLKFDRLLQRAAELKYDYVATGHYGRIEKDPKTGRYLLKKALDPAKDQSYVLYTLTQEQLAHTLFPLGGYTKQQVRAMAAEAGLLNAQKHDSQDICFVPDGKYAQFIEKYTGKKYPQGDFVDLQGNVLGQHKGIIHYTIGQRKGLGLSLPRPLYVHSINPQNNTVTLAEEKDLYTKIVTAKNINLIAVESLPQPLRLKAKIRYRQQEEWAEVTQTDSDTLRLIFDRPQRAVTKGQAVVLYDGDLVVGGGTIQ